jgi:DNA-binding CsgD family transcriptional regulator
MAMCLNSLGTMACNRGDAALASARYAEALPLWRELRMVEGHAAWLARVAMLAAATGRGERAARWFGTVVALGEALGSTILTWPAREHVARVKAEVRAALGEDAFLAAWVAGRQLTLDIATDEAAVLLDDLVRSSAANIATAPPLPGGLTPREAEVLRLLARRWTNPEIAQALSLSPHTVHRHVANIFAKLGIGSRREAAELAARLRLD